MSERQLFLWTAEASGFNESDNGELASQLDDLFKGFQMSDDGPSTHPSHDLEVLEEEDDK